MFEFKDSAENLVRSAYEKGIFRGCVLLAEKGEILFEMAAGIRDQKNSLPLDINSVFELASVSKQFAAAAVMLLRDRGLLSLSDGLEKYFPGIMYKEITVKNLLNHTSGLPDYMGWVADYGRKNGIIPRNDAVITFLYEGGCQAEFLPNKSRIYSNTAYAVLAVIIEKVSGKRYRDFLRDEFFIPAGMTDTQIYHRRLEGDTIENYAYAYVEEDGEFVLPDDTETHEYAVVLDGIEGDGVVNSNVRDLLRWDRVLREGRLLSLPTQKEMWEPTVLDSGEIISYGYGWAIENNPEYGLVVSHGGSWAGVDTSYKRYIDRDKVLIVLSNQTGGDQQGRASFLKGLDMLSEGKALCEVML